MKSTVLCSLLLLFVFAFCCVLSHCGVSVRAAGTNDVVQLIKTSKEKVGRMEKDMEENAVIMLKYYEAFNKSVHGVFPSLKEALEDTDKIEKENELENMISVPGADAKITLQNLKEKLNTAKNKKDELTKLNAEILKSEPKMIYENIKKLLTEINESKRVINNAEGSSHGDDSVVEQKATELQNTAAAARKSLEEISGKLAERYKTVSGFFSVVLQAHETMGKLMWSVENYLNEQKEKFKKYEQHVKTSFENANKMSLASEAAQIAADRLVGLCKNFEKNSEESPRELTTEKTEGAADAQQTFAQVEVQQKKIDEFMSQKDQQKKETQQTEEKRGLTEVWEKLTKNDGENIVRPQLFIFMVTTTAALWLSHIFWSF